MATSTRRSPVRAGKSQAATFLLVFVLDRTGSMASCFDATILGFNEFLHQQQVERAGHAAMTLVQFDSDGHDPICQTRYSATKLDRVADLGTPQNPYQPRGSTPLLDAVGQTIVATDAVASQYDHVLFIVQTDGHENASREYTQRHVFEMVGERRDRGWDFVFLGADIDAYDLGHTLNVPAANTMSYHAASQSGLVFASLSNSTSRYRKTGGASRGATDALSNAPVARPPDAAAPQPARVEEIDPQ